MQSVQVRCISSCFSGRFGDFIYFIFSLQSFDGMCLMPTLGFSDLFQKAPLGKV